MLGYHPALLLLAPMLASLRYGRVQAPCLRRWGLLMAVCPSVAMHRRRPDPDPTLLRKLLFTEQSVIQVMDTGAAACMHARTQRDASMRLRY